MYKTPPRRSESPKPMKNNKHAPKVLSAFGKKESQPKLSTWGYKIPTQKKSDKKLAASPLRSARSIIKIVQ